MEVANVANATATTALQVATDERLAAYVNFMDAVIENRLKRVRLEVVSEGAAETRKKAVEAAAANAKVEMHTQLLAGKAEDTAKSDLVRQEHINAQARVAQYAREDQARRGLSSDSACRVRSLLQLV